MLLVKMIYICFLTFRIKAKFTDWVLQYSEIKRNKDGNNNKRSTESISPIREKSFSSKGSNMGTYWAERAN